MWNNETVEYRKLIEVMWINKKKYFSNAFLEIFRFIFQWTLDFPRGSAGKESTCNAGDLGSIPGLEPREMLLKDTKGKGTHSSILA